MIAPLSRDRGRSLDKSMFAHKNSFGRESSREQRLVVGKRNSDGECSEFCCACWIPNRIGGQFESRFFLVKHRRVVGTNLRGQRKLRGIGTSCQNRVRGCSLPLRSAVAFSASMRLMTSKYARAADSRILVLIPVPR